MSRIVRLAVAIALLCGPAATLAQLALGISTRNFGVCAAATVTNVGNTQVVGSLGVSPGSSITGFPPGKATTFEITTPAAKDCQSQAGTTYGTCVGLPTTSDLSGKPLAGLILNPGVYNFATTASLDGTVYLNSPNSKGQFIFKIGTAFDTSVNSKVVLIGFAKACNVFWCVGSSATIAGKNSFVGALIAYQSVSVNTGTSANGGFFALNGQVSLQGNSITKSGTC